MECCTRRVAIFHRDIVSLDVLCMETNMLKDNYKKVETKDLHTSLRDLTKDER